MGALAAAFAVVFVAEIGDRTQLLIVTLASRHRAAPVVGGVVLGYGLTTVASVTVGSLVGASLPERPVQVVAGLLFLAFAVWTLRDDDEERDDWTREDGPGEHVADGSVARRREGAGLLMSTAAAIVVSEIGDKSMLATATVAAERQAAVAVALGALGGILAAGLLGVAIGRLLADRVPEPVLRRVGAALFALFGLVLLAGALL